VWRLLLQTNKQTNMDRPMTFTSGGHQESRVVCPLPYQLSFCDQVLARVVLNQLPEGIRQRLSVLVRFRAG